MVTVTVNEVVTAQAASGSRNSIAAIMGFNFRILSSLEFADSVIEYDPAWISTVAIRLQGMIPPLVIFAASGPPRTTGVLCVPPGGTVVIVIAPITAPASAHPGSIDTPRHTGGLRSRGLTDASAVHHEGNRDGFRLSSRPSWALFRQSEAIGLAHVPAGRGCPLPPRRTRQPKLFFTDESHHEE